MWASGQMAGRSENDPSGCVASFFFVFSLYLHDVLVFCESVIWLRSLTLYLPVSGVRTDGVRRPYQTRFQTKHIMHITLCNLRHAH